MSGQLERSVADMAEQLVRLDFKLDHLSIKVDRCLAGVEGMDGTPAPHLLRRLATPTPEKMPEGHCVVEYGDPVPEKPDSLSFMIREASDGRPRSTKSRSTIIDCDENPVSRSTKSRSTMIDQIQFDQVSVVHPSRRRIANTPRRRASWDCAFEIKYSNSSGRWRAITPAQAKVWKFLSNPESTFAAWAYNRLKFTFIVLAVAFSMTQMTGALVLGPDAVMLIECLIEGFFFLEVSTLFVACPYRKHFFLDGYNIIDIVSAMPWILRVHEIVTGARQDVHDIILGGFIPVVRLLKTMRYFQTSRLLVNAFILAAEATPVLVFYYVVIWLLFTAIIYAAEERSNVASLTDAMWLTGMSMTTIGYGDAIPRTPAGRMAVGFLVLFSTLYMAIPLGIIGSCFSTVWDDRDKILLFERLRSCLMEIGCSDLDVPHLFSRFDRSARGSLDAGEFLDMCDSMKLSLSRERLMTLFDFWANEEDGRIEAGTFQKVLFPRACLKELERQTTLPRICQKEADSSLVSSKGESTDASCHLHRTSASE